MANKMKLEFAGFDEVLKRLTALEADTKSIAEEALHKTFDIVTREAEIGISAPYLPAQGKYSTGRTAESLLRTFSVDWDGTVGSTNVGFQIDKGGLPSIFLIRGTPKMKKDQRLYDAFFGDKVRGEFLNAQREVFMKALEEAMK